MSGTKTYFGVAVFALAAVAAVVLLVHMSMQSALKSGSVADMSPEVVAERIAPVAQLNTGEPIVAEQPAAPASAPAQTASASARAGEQVYNTFCVACHAAGVAGAPKLGSTADWAPRIEQGMEALMNTAMNGKGAMPPKGTCSDCSEEEIRNAVEYMVSSAQ